MLRLVARRFHILGEPYRLRILQELRQRTMTVGELVKVLEGNQSNVSRHLYILHQAGILDRRRQGNNVHYSVCDSSLFKLVELLFSEPGTLGHTGLASWSMRRSRLPANANCERSLLLPSTEQAQQMPLDARYRISIK
ncbi:MAG: ArsR/SmtB family transcription factor [Terracidiphilus sp.]